MTRSMKLRSAAFCLVVCLTAFVGRGQAQASTTGSGTEVWGNWGWQVDQAPVTTTITGTAGFNTPKLGADGKPAPVQLNVNIPSATTVHEVHGNFAVAAWVPFDPNSSCGMGNGSVIAQLRDQSGNTIAAVKLQAVGIGTVNVPISGTFTTPLPASGFLIQYFVDQCGPQTISFSLVVS